MTELEEKFYKTFGIEQIAYCTLFDDECRELQPCSYQNCKEEKQRVLAYPPITDHILLELVCILAKSKRYDFDNYVIFAEDTDNLKKDILFNVIARQKYIKSDVRKLFEEE